MSPASPPSSPRWLQTRLRDPVLNAADCGLTLRDPAEVLPTKVKKSFTPPKEGGLKIKEETPEESAKKLYDLLKDKGII